MTETTLVSLSDRVRDLITSGQFQLPPIPELAVKLRTALDDDERTFKKLLTSFETNPPSPHHSFGQRTPQRLAG